MDLLLYSRYRRGGGEQDFEEWEFSTPQDWDQVSAPGQVGRRLVEGFSQRKLDQRWAPVVNNLVHWAYGTSWGLLYGLVAGSSRRPRLLLGLPFGAAVFLSDYALLPFSGLYKPIWKYDAKTLWGDFSGHLAYGSGVGLAFRLLSFL
jgi:uncharacterized membrane protein YagU involved in acid resistance